MRDQLALPRWLGFGPRPRVRGVPRVTPEQPSAGIQHWSPYNGQVMQGIGVSETRVSQSQTSSHGRMVP